MSIKKNKIELRDQSFSLSNELEEYYVWFDNFYYDYDDYCDYYCNCHLCVPEYKYLPVEQSNLIYRVGRRKNIHFANEPIIGRMIDMTSVYSKEVLRQKRIDYLLGLESEFSKPTLSDIFNKDDKH